MKAARQQAVGYNVLMAQADEPQEKAFPRLTPELAKAYAALKKEYADIFRDIRKRHRGITRDHLIQANEAELRRKVRDLLGGLRDSPC
jgi:hypothetical protein